MLTEDDVQFYRKNGYLVVLNVLRAEEVARLRASCDQFIELSRTVSAHTEMFDLEDGHSRESPRVRRIKTPHRFDETFAAMVDHAKIVAILQQLIGPAVRFDNSKLNVKAAAGGAPVEWHQDWAFYPHTNDDLCAVGIMIDATDLANGPMLVVPGSHQGPIWDHHTGGRFCGAITDPAAESEFAKAVPLTGPAGSVTVHHVRAIHGSASNRSASSRRLLLMQFRAADAWPLLGVSDLATFDALLVTGEPSVVPRVEPVPVRMPLPPASHQGSIFENQRAAPSRILAADAREVHRVKA